VTPPPAATIPFGTEQPSGTEPPFGPAQPQGPSSRFGSPAPAPGAGGAWAGNPYSEHTTDVAGRGRSLSAPAGPEDRRERPPVDRYSEHTTDVAGRGRATDKPYVPAPALPSMHASAPLVDGFPAADRSSDAPERSGRPTLGGAFPGSPGRATVTPPESSETASWPNPVEHTDQGRFDAFKAEATAATPEKAETPSVRMMPVLLSVVLAAVLVVGLAMGLVWLIAPSHSGIDVKVGDCVKRDGDKAVTATCGDPGAFQVLSTVDTKEQCPDPGQPYVLNPTSDGRTQVLCLKPTS
jgi:hypothetical protein